MKGEMGPVEASILRDINHKEYIDYLNNLCINNNIICTRNLENVTKNQIVDAQINMQNYKQRARTEQAKKEYYERLKQERERKEIEERRILEERREKEEREQEIKKQYIIIYNTFMNNDNFFKDIKFIKEELHIYLSIQLNSLYREERFPNIFNRFIYTYNDIINSLKNDKDSNNDSVIKIYESLYNNMNRELLNLEKIEIILETVKKYSSSDQGKNVRVYDEIFDYGITYSSIHTDFYINITNLSGNNLDIYIKIADSNILSNCENMEIYVRSGKAYFSKKLYSKLSKISLDYLISKM